VQPNYTKNVSDVFYQALKIGLDEIYHERGVADFNNSASNPACLAYYFNVFDMLEY
jgi:hypothetical protein